MNFQQSEAFISRISMASETSAQGASPLPAIAPVTPDDVDDAKAFGPKGAGELLIAAFQAPFLRRLIRREAEWLGQIWDKSPEAALQAELDRVSSHEGLPDLSQVLRRTRRRVALLAALADLGRVWGLDETTRALSDFAEASLAAGVKALLREEEAKGVLTGLNAERSGFVVLGMGKLGSRELNYSSDVDVIVLFDPDRLSDDASQTAKTRFAQLTRALVKLISDVDGDGYVARMDLRLRPDPASTPVCLSMPAAEQYYESYGRTWERAAHIKARPVAGDIEAGEAYLKRLTPFVWRRHLDYAAIEDAADMLARIRQHEGGADIAVEGQDVKLGAGGIREIEFLAQTRQLTMGGRRAEFRAPRTLDALKAFSAAGEISEDDYAALESAYRHLRDIEHRVQMVEDQQTHRIPSSAEGVSRLAALMGFRDVADFVTQTRAHMEAVRRISSGVLDEKTPAPRKALAPSSASLAEPGRIEEFVDRWLSGGLRAARHPRARAALERLLPEILERVSASPDPIRALTRFDRFLTGLPSGVQFFALCEANPALLKLLTDITALAPRLADYLARKPAVLDAVLDPGFFEPSESADKQLAALEASLAAETDYERVLDAARRWAAEQRFQIGVGLLRGLASPREASGAFSDLAEVCVRALWPHVLADLASAHGRPPGRGAAVLAMGKFGSREMTSRSDLDLIIIYDAEVSEMSDGAKPLAAPQYYARLTQRLTAALTAPTSEGALYEVDMRLRPSGRSGPLATSLAAFTRYQSESAWVWEQMALTRGRVVAGPTDLARDVAAAVATALGKFHDPADIRRGAAEMRGKLDAAHPEAAHRLWSLKFGPGGLVDLEFIAQTGLLVAGVCRDGGVSTDDAFKRLLDAGALSAAEAGALNAAYDLQMGLSQLESVALDEAFDPETSGDALKDLFARSAGAPNFEALEKRLAATRGRVREIFIKRIGAL
ncbi:MAG: bifunctional [glutamine synthetase] adenylyltransferase/[glutamine synthetase]-adenylyl-L-tyrosine phosphorylase [Pseudomonadota bacterium]